jgi:hypothetical protein
VQGAENSVSIKGYYKPPVSMKYSGTIIKEFNSGSEYLEVVIKGTVYDLVLNSISINFDTDEVIEKPKKNAF